MKSTDVTNTRQEYYDNKNGKLVALTTGATYVIVRTEVVVVTTHAGKGYTEAVHRHYVEPVRR